jgi:uncharacterized protein YecE (DUF72 family)
MKTWIGTSGFQYPAWKGIFYPEKMPAVKMLPFYATQFSSTEVNYSFRRIPSASTIQNWAAATPHDFRFSFKAPQAITHFAKLRECEGVMRAFDAAIQPMAQRLGAVLFQLPPSFAKDVGVLREFLSQLPPGMRAAFEFRHESWFTDEVHAALRERNAALCVSENESLAAPKIATADFGYLRLRREDYRRADVRDWARWLQSVSQSWSETFVYFKHEDTAVGTKFARQMMADLEIDPPKPP